MKKGAWDAVRSYNLSKANSSLKTLEGTPNSEVPLVASTITWLSKAVVQPVIRPGPGGMAAKAPAQSHRTFLTVVDQLSWHEETATLGWRAGVRMASGVSYS